MPRLDNDILIAELREVHREALDLIKAIDSGGITLGESVREQYERFRRVTLHFDSQWKAKGKV